LSILNRQSAAAQAPGNLKRQDDASFDCRDRRGESDRFGRGISSMASIRLSSDENAKTRMSIRSISIGPFGLEVTSFGVLFLNISR
jgi:hypothetical protein